MKSSFFLLTVATLWMLSPVQAEDPRPLRGDEAARAEHLEKAREHWKKLSPEQRKEYTARFREYQKMSPEEKERVRKNFLRWKGMPPEARQHLQNLHQHLQKLPAAERERVEQNLKRWQAMTPEEREKFRQKLRERDHNRPFHGGGDGPKGDGSTREPRPGALPPKN